MRHALTLIEDVLLLVACLAICLVVAITAVDVCFRYVLNAPLSWSHDVITQYLLIAMFFFSLPYVMRVSGHMSLDFLARRVTAPRRRNLLALLGDVVAFLVIVGIAYGGYKAMIAAYVGGDVLPDILPLPTWPSYLMVLLGAAVMALRLLIRAGDCIVAVGRDTVVGHLHIEEH